jgi:hypothetical protein
MASHVDMVCENLILATCSVFDETGVWLLETTRCAPAADWLDPIAVIGFGGEKLRASASFEVPWRMLQASHPTRSADREDLIDWVGEIANLTLGRLKTRLRQRGLSIVLGLPMTFRTPDAQTGLTTSPSLQYRLRSADGSVILRLSAAVSEAFALTTPPRTELVRDVELF